MEHPDAYLTFSEKGQRISDSTQTPNLQPHMFKLFPQKEPSSGDTSGASFIKLQAQECNLYNHPKC